MTPYEACCEKRDQTVSPAGIEPTAANVISMVIVGAMSFLALAGLACLIGMAKTST